MDWRELGTSQINLFRYDMELLSVLPPQDYVGAMEVIDEVTEMAQVRRIVGGDATDVHGGSFAADLTHCIFTILRMKPSAR